MKTFAIVAALAAAAMVSGLIAKPPFPPFGPLAANIDVTPNDPYNAQILMQNGIIISLNVQHEQNFAHINGYFLGREPDVRQDIFTFGMVPALAGEYPDAHVYIEEPTWISIIQWQDFYSDSRMSANLRIFDGIDTNDGLSVLEFGMLSGGDEQSRQDVFAAMRAGILAHHVPPGH